MASVCRHIGQQNALQLFALLYKDTILFFQPLINDKHPISYLENGPDDG